MEFSDKEKIAVFDKLESNYFHRNFGSMSKSDLETLLFSEYVEVCISNGLPFDDYTLAKSLGISQSRIRALKERKELKYPHNEDEEWWKEPFAKAVINAKYDNDDHLVKFIIQDINVMNEVRHFIEEKGWYDECSLNRKLLRIPLDCFAEICLSDESDTVLFSNESKEKFRKTCTEIKNEKDRENANQFLKDFNKDTLKSFLMSATKETICLIVKTLPFGGVAETAFNALSCVISKMQ